MREYQQLIEQYLQDHFPATSALTVTQLAKLRDGWESDNYVLTVEYGAPHRRTKWVWRLYSGVGSEAKATREFTGMQQLFAAGYPVPQVILLETAASPAQRPFVIMDYIEGAMMWELLEHAPVAQQAPLIDQFCRLFAQLHALDWRQFDRSVPGEEPYYCIDRWLNDAHRTLQNFPDIDAAPFVDWVAAQRPLLACQRPSPVHHDFHPGNILVQSNNRALVIDWTGFAVTDARFDLAWTLVLAHAYGPPEWRDHILQGYQHYAGQPVVQIELFEAMACARRLLDLTISLTQGAGRMGMNAQAVAAMRADMEPHRKVHQLFRERTGLAIAAFDALFAERNM
ncbi:MAG: phosphotransferase [Caldilineaceae bacterium]